MSEDKPLVSKDYIIKSDIPTKDASAYPEWYTDDAKWHSERFTKNKYDHIATVKGEDWLMDDNLNITKIDRWVKIYCPECYGMLHFDVEIELLEVWATYNIDSSSHQNDCKFTENKEKMVEMERKAMKEYMK